MLKCCDSFPWCDCVAVPLGRDAILAYGDRAKALAAIGFSSYRAYLSSPLWKGIRGTVFVVKGKKCVGCGGHATQVHHGDYSIATMRGAIGMLFPVCGPCHERAEVNSAGAKETPAGATKRLIGKRRYRQAKMKARAKRPKRLRRVKSRMDLEAEKALKPYL